MAASAQKSLMLITGREAARILARQGLSHSASQQLLATGIAGRPTRAGSVVLHDVEAVERLAYAIPVRILDVIRGCPNGHLVARIPRDRRFDVGAPWELQREILAGPWPMDPKISTIVWALTRYRAPMPLVATVAGFAVAGAEITAFVEPAPAIRGTSFRLAPPGDWLKPFLGRPCASGRGRATYLRGWEPSLARMVAESRPEPLQE